MENSGIGDTINLGGDLPKRFKRRKKFLLQIANSLVKQLNAVVTTSIKEEKKDVYEKGTWDGRQWESKNYLREKFNWVKDYVGTKNENPTYPGEKFRQRFAIPRSV